MLLTEYDEQAHIENEKEIAREEGLQQGIEQGIEQGLRQGIGQGIQQGEGRLSTLVGYLKRDGRINDLDLIADEKARRRLYEEYHLTD